MSLSSNNAGKMLVTVLVVVFSVILTFYIMTNPTGAFAGLGKMLTAIGILLGIVNPRAALYFLGLYAIYVDHLKRVGVIYGVISYQTVQEILLGPLATIAAMNLAYLYGVLMNRYRLDGVGKFLYAAVVILMAGMLLGGVGDGGSGMLKLYNAGTIAAYLTIIPIAYGILHDLADWRKLVDFMTIVAVPAAAWGFVQYANGFSLMEWAYAKTGLSPTHSVQMLTRASPRIFGWFGSESAYGVVGLFAAYCMLRVRGRQPGRWLFYILGLFYFCCTVASEQRAILFLLPIYFVSGYLFRYKMTTLITYVVIATLFVLSVINAAWMISEGLPMVNRLIGINTAWGRKVLIVNTFSDRLQGWERLGYARSWSWFGTWSSLDKTGADVKGSAEYNHDIINRVLIKFGATGVVFLLVVGIIVLSKCHAIVFNTRDPRLRKSAAAILGVMIPFVLLSFAGGGNFSTTPINMLGWLILAAMFIIKRENDRLLKEPVSEEQETPSPVLMSRRFRDGHPSMS